MSKFRIEIQITLLTIIIGIVVVTIGYFSYKSLSKIVYSIQQGFHPDRKIYIIKDIDSDLNALENSVRLYALTNNYDVLDELYSLEDNIALNINKLHDLKERDKYDLAVIDSISVLSQEKLDLWDEILNIHLSKKGLFPAFSKLYSTLDEKKTDTVSADTQNIGVMKKITGSLETRTDTTLSEPSIERKTIKKKIQKLEWEIYNNNKRKNEFESQLIEKNVIISGKINRLISETEIREENALLEKTNEVDRLAEVTYKRLALFTISAVLLLFIALFVLFNYLKKTRATQRALADARKKAETLAYAKEQFAANVSHELRTPVNAIYGLTEQVLQKKLDNDTSEMVTVIFKSAGHLRNIVNDTLDFSKIQYKNIILESVHFSPAEIFEEVLALVKYEAIKKGIELKYNWNGDNPGILIGDPLRLKQIIINLIGNAIKFTEKGEVAIKVKGLKHSQQNFELEIQVIDTGIGIEEKNLKLVFDEYVQIENKSGKKYSGTGLGLSIVKRLVELQGGKIRLESNPEIGTKVTVNISYREGELLNVEQAKKEILEIPESFRQLSVLIADDEDYNRFLLKSILQKWNVQFKEAKNGNEVIDAACKEHFDIILMDINMPEINGFEAAKVILQCHSDIKIVAVTAATDQLDQKAYFKAGMKGFLFKPFAEKDLLDIFVSLVDLELPESQSKITQQVSIAELLRLAGGDDKFLVEMIQLFIKSAKTGITGIEQAIKSEKWNEVFENAHKMAAPVKHIGAGRLYENIKLLEKISQQPEPVDTIAPVFQEIKNELEELNTLLKSYLDELKT